MTADGGLLFEGVWSVVKPGCVCLVRKRPDGGLRLSSALRVFFFSFEGLSWDPSAETGDETFPSWFLHVFYDHFKCLPMRFLPVPPPRKQGESSYNGCIDLQPYVQKNTRRMPLFQRRSADHQFQ